MWSLINISNYFSFIFFIFNSFRDSLKAVSCIVAAFDILRSNSQTFNKDSEDFMRQWVIKNKKFILLFFQILFLINESTYETKLINDVYSVIVDYYNKYESIKFIQCNLSKSHALTFY